MAKLVSRTYGEALFDLAMEKEQGTAFLEEVEAVRNVLSQNPEFDKLMEHPGISKQEKLTVLENVFKGRVSDEMTGFLTLVVQKERYGELSSIFQYFSDRMKEENGIGTAYVTSAVELSETQKAAVRARLLTVTPYRTVEIAYSVDPALIGGMVIRIKDRVVDSSIRTKLYNMKKALLA